MPRLPRLALASLLVGCASVPGPSAEGPAPSPADPAIAAWAVDPSPEGAPVARVARSEPPPARGTVRIAPPPEDALRGLDRGRRIDLDLADAPLASALRLLADAADVGLVCDEGLTVPVSARLRGVRPIEAMRALSEAHGVELTRVGRTIVARRP